MGNKLTKKELEVLVKDLENKLIDYDKLKINEHIHKTARLEDAEKVKKAEIVLSTFKDRENEIIKSFKIEHEKMNNSINEQNSLIVSLFNMMDSAINNQIIMYNNFKNLYISQVGEENFKQGE